MLYKNKISIIGTGYVGLVGGVCLANFGNNIINVDIDAEKIDKLNKGEVPIYEPGLNNMLEKNVREDRITFTTDVESAIKESEVIFIAVGTPPAEDGSADLKHVLDVAHTIGKNMNSYKVVVDKSTVPVGTGRRVQEIIQSELDNRGVDYNFDVVSNPEFLREGKAVHDFTHPDRIIIGTESEKARDILSEVYRALYLNDVPFVFTNLETAEMIKYASNAFLATKISFINEMSVLCEKVNANVQKVAKNESAIMSELTSVFGTPPTTMTGVINNLVGKDYVKRRRRSDDRRVVEVLLSQHGNNFYKKDKNMAKENAKNLLKKIDDRLIETMLEIFMKINEKNKILNRWVRKWKKY